MDVYSLGRLDMRGNCFSNPFIHDTQLQHNDFFFSEQEIKKNYLAGVTTNHSNNKHNATQLVHHGMAIV
jgi:hypothetical protein